MHIDIIERAEEGRKAERGRGREAGQLRPQPATDRTIDRRSSSFTNTFYFFANCDSLL